MKTNLLRVLAMCLLGSRLNMGATFTVTTAEDSGPGSLRQAILDANATADADVIEFTIPGPIPHKISPASALPTITRTLTIDGTTQPGFAGRPVIELDGSASSSGDGLRLRTGNCTVRSLVINRFQGQQGAPRAGILMESGGRNLVEANFVGTDTTGTIALGNQFGIVILNSANNVIGGTNAAARNLISGNLSQGIDIEGTGASANRVQGNLIGTDVTGTLALGNANGITIFNSANNLVGGTNAASGNVIAGNHMSGVHIGLSSASANRVQGNFVGTDITGTAALGNGRSGVTLDNAPNNLIGGAVSGSINVISGNVVAGVEISRSGSVGNRVEGNLIGLDVTGRAMLGNEVGVALHSGASNNAIGGTNGFSRNIISGNLHDGVQLHPGGSTARNRVQGNFIGTDVAGMTKLSNGGNGVALEDVSNNTIGGTNSAARNLISGNAANGIEIKGKASTRNFIMGNAVGTDVSGAAKLGNSGHGISVLGGASNNTIGGVTSGAGNTIAFNGSNGIDIEMGTGNAVRANSFFANVGLAIDLGSDGATGNDAGDGDTGANNFQNSPVLTTATAAGGSLTIQGILDGATNSTFELDLFSNIACVAAGMGQGENYLGSAAITLNASGETVFNLILSATVSAGQFLAATVTDALGNTSEFSACRVVIAGDPSPRLSVAKSVSSDQLVFSWPASANGFVLELTENLSPPLVWTALTNPSVVISGQNTVTLTLSEGRSRFYRIRKP